MNRKLLAGWLALSLAAPAGAAQLYRSVDEQGRVEWRDTPPPGDARSVVEARKIQGNLAPSTPRPYAVQQAVKNFPVTLWTANCGAGCDRAKDHLVKRGVPYTEKDAKADLEGLRKATGALDVPVLFVGREQLRGYSKAEWDRALDAAGYPDGRTAP